MQHFIIDGYNALFTLKPFLRASFRSRDGFLLYLKTAWLFGSRRNKATVVFDGRQGVISNQPKIHAPLRIIFAKRSSADEEIVHLVEKEKHPQHTTVVTDDRELTERVKLLGARTIAVRVFFAGLMKREEPPPDGKPSPGSKVGKSITDAMKKEWGIDE